MSSHSGVSASICLLINLLKTFQRKLALLSHSQISTSLTSGLCIMKHYNNDSLLLLATTKPVDNKNSEFVSDFLYAVISLCTTLRKPGIVIQLVRKRDEFSRTSHTRAVIQTHTGRTMNVSQNI